MQMRSFDYPHWIVCARHIVCCGFDSLISGSTTPLGTYVYLFLWEDERLVMAVNNMSI